MFSNLKFTHSFIAISKPISLDFSFIVLTTVFVAFEFFFTVADASLVLHYALTTMKSFEKRWNKITKTKQKRINFCFMVCVLRSVTLLTTLMLW